MDSLKIYLFGSFEVLLNNKKLSGPLWQSRQIRTILKLLVANKGTPLPASQIIETIWPDKDPDSAIQQLYVRISQLRRLLSENKNQNWIQRVHGGYLFNYKNTTLTGQNSGFLWIDVDQFEKYADKGRVFLENKQYQSAIESFEKAARIYRSDYLIEDIYEDWTIAERERLRDRYIMTLTELAEAFALSGKYRRAIDTCEKVLAIDPFRETTYLQLMLYYYYAGDKSRSLDVFSQCKHVLEKELGVEPFPSTIRIAEEIRSGTLKTNNDSLVYPQPLFDGRLFEVPLSLSNPPFIGRKRELSWLLQSLKDKLKPIVWIKGEAGIGKTRLLQEFEHHISKSGYQVFKLDAGLCSESPLGIWSAARQRYPGWFTRQGLDQKSRPIFDLLFSEYEKSTTSLPELYRTGDFDRVQDQMAKIIVSRLPDRSIFWIDDAHLIDDYSLDLLIRMAERTQIFLSGRSGSSHFEQRLSTIARNDANLIHSLELAHLPPQVLQDLLDQMTGQTVRELADQIYDYTNGNPFYIFATLQHLFEEGVLFVSPDGSWQQTETLRQALSPTVEKTIADRLNQNLPEEQRILDLLAVAGGSVNYNILEHALAHESSFLLNHTDHLIERNFIYEPRESGIPDLRFTHALYREVVYNALPEFRKKNLHRLIGETILEIETYSPALAGSLAIHFHLGGNLEKAAHFAVKAGDHAMRLYAPVDAIQHYQQAFEWNPESKQDETRSAEIGFRLAEAWRLTGKYDRAEELYQAVIPNLNGTLKQAAIYQSFQIQVLQGRSLTDFSELVELAEDSSKNEGGSWALALLYWSSSFIQLLQGNPGKTRKLNAKAWRVARELRAGGDTPPGWVYNRALTLMMRSHNLWGNYQTSIHFSKRNHSFTQSTTTPDVNIKAVIKASLGESHYHLGNYQLAKECFLEAQKSARKAGDIRLHSECLLGLGWIYYEEGDLKAAAVQVGMVLKELQVRSDILRHIQAVFLKSKIEMDTNDYQESITALENISQLARFQGSDAYLAQSLALLAELYFANRQHKQSAEAASEALHLSIQSGSKRTQCTALRLLGIAKYELGDTKSGEKLIANSINLAEQISVPFEKGLSLRAHAVAGSDRQISLQNMQAACEIFATFGAKHEEQKTCLLLNDFRPFKEGVTTND